MALHQENCDICRQISLCQAGNHPRFIAELETGFAVLGPVQYFRGYALLLSRTPATELDEMPEPLRTKFLQDMAALAGAVRAVVRPHKINYECLGNQVHHLHWHIFPRTRDEPEPLKPVWLCMPDDEDRYRFDAVRDAPIIAGMRFELERALAAREQ